MEFACMPTDVDPPISPVDLEELRRTVDPLANSDCCGILTCMCQQLNLLHIGLYDEMHGFLTSS